MGKEAIRFTPESADQGIDQVIIGYERSEDFMDLEPDTQKAYRQDWFHFRSYLLRHGVETFAELKPEHFNSWVSEMQSSYKPTTITRRVASLRSFLSWAVEEKIIKPNFMENLPPIYRPKKRLPESLTFYQVHSLLAEAKKEESLRNLVIVLLLLETGGKLGQILKLNRQDILFRDNQILVRLRSSKKEKEAPVKNEASEIIRQFLQQEDYRSPDEPLFLGRSGHRLTRQGFWLHLESYGRRIGISDLSVPMIRNTWRRKLRSAS